MPSVGRKASAAKSTQLHHGSPGAGVLQTESAVKPQMACRILGTSRADHAGHRLVATGISSLYHSKLWKFCQEYRGAAWELRRPAQLSTKYIGHCTQKVRCNLPVKEELLQGPAVGFSVSPAVQGCQRRQLPASQGLCQRKSHGRRFPNPLNGLKLLRSLLCCRQHIVRHPLALQTNLHVV